MTTTVKASGPPVSAVITPGGASPVTITDITNAQAVYDDELIEHLAGNKRTPLYVKGKEVRGFEFETSDLNLLTTCRKGTYCSAAVLTLEGAKVGHPGASQNTDADVTVTLTHCTQVIDNSVNAVPGGAHGRYKMRFLACQNPADGTEGTCTVAVA